MCVYVCICMYMYVYVCMYVYVYTDVFMYVTLRLMALHPATRLDSAKPPEAAPLADAKSPGWRPRSVVQGQGRHG